MYSIPFQCISFLQKTSQKYFPPILKFGLRPSEADPIIEWHIPSRLSR